MMTTGEDAVAAFWAAARRSLYLSDIFGWRPEGGASPLAPPAWSFGGTTEQADRLLELVLAGTKTATAGAQWDYEAADEPLPRAGDLSIVLDGAGAPRALIRTTEVAVVPFDQVDAEHARLEGEGDLSLGFWREAHERFFTEHADHDHGFSTVMPVVLERFEVLFPH